MAQAPITPAQRSRILAAFDQGGSNTEAAEAGGVSLATVKRVKASVQGGASASAGGGRVQVRPVAKRPATGQREAVAWPDEDAPEEGEAPEDGDLVDILRRELAYARRARRSAKGDGAKAKWSKRVDELVTKIERLQPPPPPPPDLLQQELRRLDAQAIALLEQHLPDPIRPEEIAA